MVWALFVEERRGLLNYIELYFFKRLFTENKKHTKPKGASKSTLVVADVRRKSDRVKARKFGSAPLTGIALTYLKA